VCHGLWQDQLDWQSHAKRSQEERRRQEALLGHHQQQQEQGHQTEQSSPDDPSVGVAADATMGEGEVWDEGVLEAVGGSILMFTSLLSLCFLRVLLQQPFDTAPQPPPSSLPCWHRMVRKQREWVSERAGCRIALVAWVVGSFVAGLVVVVHGGQLLVRHYHMLARGPTSRGDGGGGGQASASASVSGVGSGIDSDSGVGGKQDECVHGATWQIAIGAGLLLSACLPGVLGVAAGVMKRKVNNGQSQRERGG
jgi:hypothetical protein